MALTEGVKGTGIEANHAAHRELEVTFNKFMVTNITINMVQDGSVAIKVQLTLFVFFQHAKNLLVDVNKQEVFLLQVHDGTVEQVFANIPESITAQLRIIMSIGPDHDIDNLK